MKIYDDNLLAVINYLARITGYYLGGIITSGSTTEVNERGICKILKSSPETSMKCQRTCGSGTVGEGLEIRTCHAGLSVFALGCPSGGTEEALRIVGGKVLTRLVGREHCLDLAIAADVDAYRIIEALGDVRLESNENLLNMGAMLETIHEGLSCRLQEPVMEDEGVENVTAV